MYTDPGHLRAQDPGKVEGNVVFTYLDAFDEDKEAVAELKARYRRGGLGDVTLKQRLDAILQGLLDPIRARRAFYARDLHSVLNVLRDGTRTARAVTDATLHEVQSALGLFTFE